MKHTQTQKKNQYFVLFWLGLLTGALLIVALYSMGSNSADLAGKLRRVPTTAPSYNYTIPAYNSTAARVSQPGFVAPQTYNPQANPYSTVGNDSYGPVGNDGYFNSLLHVAPTSTTSLRSKVVAPSVNSYGVNIPNYGDASRYTPVFNSYTSVGNDGYTSVGNDGYAY